MVSGIEIQDQDGIIIATLPPEIDLSNVRDVRAQLFDSFPSSKVALIIDLSRTKYLDSKGIQLLMEVEQHAQMSQRPLRLAVAPSHPVTRLLEITGVPTPRYESVVHALQDILGTT